MALKVIKLNSFALKIALFAACAVLSLMMFFFARWCFGNSISTRAGDLNVAEFAAQLAPNDPQTHYALGFLSEKTFLDEDLKKSVSEYERATALSPNDYRLWFALGKARERAGDAAGAELALKKALELAPNYSQIHWALGNFLLRQGKTDEAFAEIRRAAEDDNTFVNPAVSTAWQFFGGDADKIKNMFGDLPAINSMLTAYLTNEKRYDEALKIWNSIPDEDKKNRFNEAGNALFRQMFAAGKFRAALEIHNQIAEEADKFTAEIISNGGFEKDVKPNGASILDWQLGDGQQPQIGFDDVQKSEGERSLVIVFNSADGRDFRTVSQTMIVQPGKKYQLSFSYKTDLKTAATFHWEIVETLTNEVLAATDSVSDKKDWTEMILGFTTSADVEAVTFRLARDKCPQGICPITGKIWFDDFQLEK